MSRRSHSLTQATETTQWLRLLITYHNPRSTHSSRSVLWLCMCWLEWLHRRAITEQLRADGVRLTLAPPREISEKAQRYLAEHPELYQQAFERAKRMGLIKQLRPPMITPDLQNPGES